MSRARLDVVVDRRGDGWSQDAVSIWLPGGAETVDDLVAALGGTPDDRVRVGARWLDGDTPVKEAGIRRGDLLVLGADRGAGGGGAGSAQAGTAEGTVEVRVIAGLNAGDRAPLADATLVVGRDPAADLAIGDGTVSARHARVSLGAAGALIEDLGARNGVQVGGDLASGPTMVPLGSVVDLGASQIIVLPSTSHDGAHVGPPGPDGRGPFHRPPRSVRLSERPKLVAPARPQVAAAGVRFGAGALIAPIVMGLLMAMLFSPLMAVFVLCSPLMLLANWLDDRRRISRQRRTVERRFTDEVQQFEDSRAAAAAEERRARWTTAPDLAETVRRALLPSRMLWERRGSDDDFLRLAVGTGAACWSAVVDEGDAGALCGVPVVVGLAGRRLGLAGPRPSVAAAVRGLLVQAAAHHGPADLRIAVVTTPEHAADWEWLKWLPHVGEPSLLAINDGGLEDLCRHLRNDLDLLLLIDHDLAETASGAGASRTLDAAGSAAGRRLSAIAIADETSRLPAWCTTSLAVLPDGANASLQGEGADRWVGPVRLAGLPLHTAERCARALASLSDPASSDGGLPEHVVLDELFGRPVDSPSDIERRWRSHPTTSLRVPIGRTESGPFMFDLVADGPHALIGGTTGSGKSELLRTLIAGMAATVDPEHLQLVLLDFKGGSAFAPFADLPHTAGLVTDLDGTLARRALRALRAELRRREQVLKTVGATDLAAYYSEGHDREEPFPRLVVMVDEFATMAAELPDFVDSLVGIAQRGRSLGVHLVLATQRPHGAVNENVRANTSARLSLRVQDAADSRDVIGVDAAAGISRHRPGRGFCRLGHGELVSFQAAVVSSLNYGCSGISVEPFGLTGAGGGKPPGGQTRPASESSLAALVGAIRDAAESAGLRSPHRPWTPPLPATLSLDDLVPARRKGVAVIGLLDNVDEQRQVPFGWSPEVGNVVCYGGTGSGASSALATLALSIGRSMTPDEAHIYVLDFGSQTLAPLAGLPHVGAVIGPSERERQERLLRRLRCELDGRRDRAGRDGEPPPRDQPAVILIVDNYGGFHAAFDDGASLRWRDELSRLVADGPEQGIHVLIGADRPGAVPPSIGNVVAEKLVFRLADPIDAALLGLPAKAVAGLGSGRALHQRSQLEVQIAEPGPEGLASAVSVVASTWPHPTNGPAPIGMLPAVVALADVGGADLTTGAEWWLPVGVGDDALSPVGFRLVEGEGALVAGPARSGRSTVLANLARAVRDADRDARVLVVCVGRQSPGLTTVADRVITNSAEVPAALAAVAADASNRWLVLVDDAEMVEDLDGSLARLLDQRHLHYRVVVAGRADWLRTAYGHWTSVVRRSGRGVVLRPNRDLDGEIWQISLPRHGPLGLPVGRGYLVSGGQTELVQTAGPDDPTPQEVAAA